MVTVNISCAVAVQRADSKHRSCQSDSSMCCHNNSIIGEEGNGKPPHKLHFPRKKKKKLRALSLVSATLEIEYATNFFCSGYEPNQRITLQYYLLEKSQPSAYRLSHTVPTPYNLSAYRDRNTNMICHAICYRPSAYKTVFHR